MTRTIPFSSENHRSAYAIQLIGFGFYSLIGL